MNLRRLVEALLDTETAIDAQSALEDTPDVCPNIALKDALWAQRSRLMEEIRVTLAAPCPVTTAARGLLFEVDRTTRPCLQPLALKRASLSVARALQTTTAAPQLRGDRGSL